MDTLMRRCRECKWEWAKRRGAEEPKRCPKCHSVCWNRERKEAGRPVAGKQVKGGDTGVETGSGVVGDSDRDFVGVGFGIAVDPVDQRVSPMGKALREEFQMKLGSGVGK